MSKGVQTDMTQIRDVIHRLRKKHAQRLISRETHIDRSIVKKIYDLAVVHQWLDSDLPMPSDEEIAKVWKPKTKTKTHILEPYYESIKSWHNEGHTAVVMQHLLKDKCPCDIQVIRRYILKHFPESIEPVMVRPTFPGKDMEVDFGYLGLFLDKNEVLKKTYVFSARLRHSRKTYREIVLYQNTSTFLLCHVHAFEYFNGVSEHVILDNTKAGIIQSTIDNNMINRSYQELAEYYGFTITPCLPRTPAHKGGVEGDIKYIKCNFLPYFREKQKERNIKQSKISDLIEALKIWDAEVADVRIVYGIGRSPIEIFNTEEKKALQPLPKNRWELVSWSQCTVRRDWRIMHECAYYSAPYLLIGKSVQVCTTSSLVRIFYEHKEVAFHEKAKEKWEYRRKTEHAPPFEEAVLQTTREGLLLQAEKIGPFTYQVASEIFSNPSVEKLRPVRFLLKLENKYSQERLEKACQRACKYKLFTYINVKKILENSLDKQTIDVSNANKVIPIHQQYRFVRNSEDYKSTKQSKETFEERLLREYPVSKYGHAMMKPWDSLMADRIMEEENER